MRRAAIAAVALVIATSTIAASSDSEICADMPLTLDDPSKVVPACRNLAEKGNVFAQFMLGFIYVTGMRGHKSVVQQDSAEAAKWFGLAAAQGNTLCLN
jgi:TPR repeat protein